MIQPLLFVVFSDILYIFSKRLINNFDFLVSLEVHQNSVHTEFMKEKTRNDIVSNHKALLCLPYNKYNDFFSVAILTFLLQMLFY